MYIYFDESGDLGNNTQDPYFVLAGIATHNPKKLAKAVMRLRETLKTKSQKQEKELKYSKASDIINWIVRLLADKLLVRSSESKEEILFL